MNEQIKELFMKACRHADYEHQNVPKELVDKFAELIIRECIAQCADNDSTDEWDKGVRWAANQIKEHFGVEE